MDNEIIKILKAIDNNWILCDDNDDDDFMVFVNESRIIKDDLKPLKIVIKKMEEDNFIKTNDHFTKRKYMKLLGKKIPIPFTYEYTITKKGRKRLSNFS